MRYAIPYKNKGHEFPAQVWGRKRPALRVVFISTEWITGSASPTTSASGWLEPQRGFEPQFLPELPEPAFDFLTRVIGSVAGKH